MKLDTIYCGHVLDVLQALPDESVDCIITSPPFWGQRSYGGEEVYAIWHADPVCNHEWIPETVRLVNENRQGLSGGAIGLGEKTLAKHGKKEQTAYRCRHCTAWYGPLGMESDPDEYIFKLQVVAGELRRVLKPTGTLWFNIADTFYKKDLRCIPEKVMFAFKEVGWILRNKIVWAKNNPTPESVRDRFTKAHEMVYLFVKNKRYWFDLDAVKVPTKDGKGRKNPGDWWVIQVRPDRTSHIAVFPEELIVPMVLAGCPEGGVVLDPFSGRGTTLRVAYDLNRHYIGIDIKPEYAKLAEAYIHRKI